MSEIPSVSLRPKSDKRVASGHPWVFSNEIDGDVKSLPKGGAVDVFDARGKFLGRGYANPASLIAIRILTRRRKEDIDSPYFFADRFREALSLRAAAYPGRQSCRLVFGEADGLAGLIVDRYGDHLSVQLGTLGMEVRRAVIREALETVFSPTSAVLRNDAPTRSLEGLPRGREVWFGEAPESLSFDEAGIRFTMPLLGGQKTGHFFDQYDNKRAAAPFCAGRSVLDVYANTGGWALHALQAGASHATVVDSDEANTERALDNAEANGFADRFDAIAHEGKATLQHMVHMGRRFGVVVLDPPAFAKTRKAVGSALRGYREINTLGITLTEPGGFFFTSSCSFHILEDRFVEEIAVAADTAGRRLKMVYRGSQASDHPVLSRVPETRYLKCFGFQVLMGV